MATSDYWKGLICLPTQTAADLWQTEYLHEVEHVSMLRDDLLRSIPHTSPFAQNLDSWLWHDPFLVSENYARRQ